MIEKMSKYGWIVLSSEKDAFLEALRSLGVVDIRRSSKPVDEQSQAYIDQINALKAELSCLEKGSNERVESLRSSISALHREEKAAAIWGDYDKAKLETFGIKYYRIPSKKFHASWAEYYPLQLVAEKDGKVWFVVVGNCNFPLKENCRPERTVTEIRKDIEAAEAALGAELAVLSEHKKDIPELKERMAALQSDLSLYFASLKGSSQAEGHLSVFEGFAPSSEDEALAKEFDALNLVWVRFPANAADKPPIKLKNNAFSRQFEVFTRMYGLPSYNEFDPTVFLSIFFLLFFAICMGDAGYGLVLMLVGFLLRKKEGGLASLWRLIMILGAGTFVVGLAMGAFFGINLSVQTWVPSWFKKIMITGDFTIAGMNYEKQMVLSLVIGIVHICLALILKAVWAVRKSGLKQSLSALGWTLLIVGAVVTFSVGMFGILSSTAMKCCLIGIAAVSALGIFIFNKWGRNPLLNIGAGLWDTYSMASGLMGDVLSYIRLYALGLSGGLLGATFNLMATMVKGDNPSWQWLPFILIIIFGHALNIAMSCLGAFVHPLRLNFVEFFKNSAYEGAGDEYKPLK